MKELVAFMVMTLLAGQGFGQLQKKSETVHLNGIDLYYEVYGEGEPLLLLHGWTQSSQFWSAYIPLYARHFQVYAIDLRGHGRTSPLTGEFTIAKSAKDVLALLEHLQLEKTKAIGLSYGGLTLLELANSNPEKIESMVLIGASHKYDGAENSKGDNAFSYENLPAPFVEELKKTHHHGEGQIRALFNPTLNYRIGLSDEELKAINSKTLIVSGDRDEILGIDPAIALHKNLPNSELWIVPNMGHLAIIGPNKEDFLKKSVQFLAKE